MADFIFRVRTAYDGLVVESTGSASDVGEAIGIGMSIAGVIKSRLLGHLYCDRWSVDILEVGQTCLTTIPFALAQRTLPKWVSSDLRAPAS